MLISISSYCLDQLSKGNVGIDRRNTPVRREIAGKGGPGLMYLEMFNIQIARFPSVSRRRLASLKSPNAPAKHEGHRSTRRRPINYDRILQSSNIHLLPPGMYQWLKQRKSLKSLSSARTKQLRPFLQIWILEPLIIVEEISICSVDFSCQQQSSSL